MILARFDDERALAAALRLLRGASVGPLETYTPAPLADADESSSIPAIVLLVGLLGFAASFALQSYSAAISYRFDVGGRPPLAWPAFVPNAFENAVLIAVVTGFVAFCVAARLTRLYDPVDEAAMMRRASSDAWIVAVRSTDSGMIARARTVLRACGATEIASVSP